MKFPGRKADSDLDREVRHHLETLADGYQRQGMTREEAMRQARLEFGGVEGIKEECRDEHAWAWLAHTGQDVRFGWRMMRKTPAITLAAVVSLALGIGATTAILTLADGLLWKDVGAPAPEQLVELLWESKDHPDGLVGGSWGGDFEDGAMDVRDFFTEASYQAMRTGLAGKAQVAAHINSVVVSTNVRGQVLISRARGVSGDFFSMLELRPFEGRLLTDEDDGKGSPPVVVVTHRFWRRHLNEDPRAIGSTMRINNTIYTIAGVLPPEFTGIVPAEDTDLYCAIQQSPRMLEPGGDLQNWIVQPTTWWMQLMARRAPGVSDEQLRTQLQVAFAASWPARPKSAEATPRIRISSAETGLGGLKRHFGNPLWMLLGLVALVLLVACANIANLLLARAAGREKEVALRVSLGCGARQLVRQFFTESLMLALMGGVLSIAVAAALGALMVNLIPAREGNSISLEPNAWSLAGTAAITLFTALLFGLYPARRASRVDPSVALQEGSGSGGTLSRARWMPARLLVLFQVALGVLLVSAAIIFTSYLADLVNRDTGFDRGQIMLFDLRPGEIGYRAGRLKQFYFDVEDRLNQVSGVDSAALARTRPMQGGGFYSDIKLAGQAKGINTAVHHITPKFFGTMGIPILTGRALTQQDVRTGAKVIVLGEDVAKRLGGASSLLGRQVTLNAGDYTVVGIARHARYARMEEEQPAVVYVPFDYSQQSASFVVRTSIPPQAAVAAVRNAVRDLDRNLPMVDVFTMEQQIARTLQRERLFAWLCGSFGVLALVLCVVGLYGLMSHMTARRTPEMGIRMALGASRGDVVGQVLREGMKLASAGLALGIPLAVWAARIAKAQQLLPEGPLPYWKLAAALAVLGIAATLAVLGPAVRASSVDPMRALRRG